MDVFKTLILDTPSGAGGSGTVTSVDLTAGTGISVSGGPITSSGSITVTNASPDQTVTIADGTGISVTGTYPSFTITNSSPSLGGDIVGPASAVDSNFAAFDTTTGKLIKDSGSTTSTFATAAQGTLADSATQPGDNVSTLTNDAGYTTNVGDLVGPASSTDNAIVRYDSTTGKLVQNSGVTIDDSGNVDITSTTASTSTTTGALQVAGGAGVAENIFVGGKVNVNTTQALYIPEGDFTGTMYVGDGGGSLTYGSGSDGQNNTSVGIGALFANTTGKNNTAVGYSSLTANTTGRSNVAVGNSSLTANTTGKSNIAIGGSSLFSNIDGDKNIGVGSSSLADNTSGDENIAVGNQALGDNISGNSNTAVGTSSLKLNTTGGSNVAIGASSLFANIDGISNTAVGTSSLIANTSGDNNTAVGTFSLGDNTSGTQNVAVGNLSLDRNTTANGNAAVGYSSLYFNTTGNYNTAQGYNSLINNTTGLNNTAVGANAGSGITTGSNNTIIGADVTGLAAGLTSNIILANGTGAIKAQHDGTDWSLTGALSATGSITSTGQGLILSHANPRIDFIGSAASQTWYLGDGIGATNGNFVLRDGTNSTNAITVTQGTRAIALNGPVAVTGTLSTTGLITTGGLRSVSNMTIQTNNPNDDITLGVTGSSGYIILNGQATSIGIDNTATKITSKLTYGPVYEATENNTDNVGRSSFNFIRGTTTVGQIVTNNTTCSYNSVSDYRLKDVAGPVVDSGTFIDSLQPKVGTWKSNGSAFVGFLAHEFAEVSPSSVVGEKDAVDEDGNPIYQSMQAGTSEVIANLVAETQSLRNRVAALESQ